MNQKAAFYLISIVLVFFIGYSYSQYNSEPPEPVIINLDNSLNESANIFPSGDLAGSLHFSICLRISFSILVI